MVESNLKHSRPQLERTATEKLTNFIDLLFFKDPLGSFDVSTLENETGFVPCSDHWSLWGPPSPSCLTVKGKAVNEIQHSPLEPSQGHGVISKAASASKYSSIKLKLAHETKFKCRYLGCHKMFRRREHLKRHQQTFHGEGPNRFACEFCGRDQFNRRDNLNNHRKLHARPRSGNRSVKFIPAAIPIIEQEERNRKRRTGRKSKAIKGF
ncbi:putative zinc finger protein odd-paired-like (opl) [Metarhizium acridum CQMa 102]|uniref:Putative zinc finger protein odd-paired-like (Opl) n=1 Tax=Metarhizium acridum (strain CQMa 102) TaxID=655827 RepID=E9EDX2_METAQ|nr:putative zinc finger protein odd-paired-like (opl) [Metarhizium acridum CQMa 102]EFY85864.1 putative zinc finger protein odd-paired-like (opl) [Metarhizium acridum CQMa 102]